MRHIFLNFFIFIFINNALAENNFFDVNFDPSDITKIKKEWEYNSGLFKSTQSKPEVYKNRVIFLDGYKNLKVLSLIDGSEICSNISKKPDRGPQRGVLLFEKNQKNVFAIFFRHKTLNIIDIKNCNKIILKNKIIIDKPVSSKLLSHKEKLIILINGSEPRGLQFTPISPLTLIVILSVIVIAALAPDEFAPALAKYMFPSAR